jgi:rhodanese-related sulfurtransferase
MSQNMIAHSETFMAAQSPFRQSRGDSERINADNLVKLMKNCHPYDKLVIVDCRSQYEWNGGHIQGGKHCQSRSDFEKLFQDDYTANTCFVFHCEYSQIRGPAARKTFLEIVREHNVTTPHTYVLDRGYRGFYSKHSELCTSGYLPQPE